MTQVADHPILLFALSFPCLTLAAWFGSIYRKRYPLPDDAVDGFDVIINATLTLLALLIGFTFSMALTRYDQRKNYEEAEANAIGTEFVRTDLLPASDRAKVRALLLSYVNERVLFYTVHDQRQRQQIDARTTKLQADLWSSVAAPARAQPTPVAALAVSGMNDVLNSQGYTQAAWWNRIPLAAWALMAAISICSTVLVGYDVSNPVGKSRLLVVLPLIISIAFFLIADIESPITGIIRVEPRNLLSLLQSLQAQ